MRATSILFSLFLWSFLVNSQPLSENQFLASMTDQTFARALRNEKTKVDAIVTFLDVDTSNLNWLAEATGKTPAYRPDSDTLSIPVSLGEGQATLTLFVHEFAHAVFERYMQAKSPAWKAVRVRVPQITVEERTKRDRSNDLEFSKLGKSEEQVRVINIEIDHLELEIKALQAEDRVLVAKQFFMNSYHEFFADSLATLNDGDLNVMRDSVATLNLSNTEDARLSLQWRSFSFDFNQIQTDIWQQQIRRIQGLVGYFNPYDLLAPLRSCYGQRVLVRGFSEANKRVLAERMAIALKKDFESRIESIDATTSALDPKEMNSILCQSL